jgi:hypothetical protein
VVDEGIKKGHEMMEAWYREALRNEIVYERRKLRGDFKEKRFPFQRKQGGTQYKGKETKINAVKTDEEREEHRKKGLCFRCSKPGHLSRNCPDRTGSSNGNRSFGGNNRNIREVKTEESAEEEPARVTSPMDLARNIRAMIMALPDDERNTALDELEAMGFQ